jgi:hypothetical protein
VKVKIINKELSHYNEELKVTRLNYNMVMAKIDEEKLCFSQEDVQMIPENEYEKAILKCKDIVKIKLQRGISLLFYTAVLNCLEKTIGGSIRSIDVLKDEHRPLRKGLWEKLMLMVVNEEHALTVSVTGRHFGRNFDVTVSERCLEDFVDECEVEIEWYMREIKEKKNQIKRYRKAIGDVVSNHGRVRNELLALPDNNRITAGSA